MCGVKLSLNWLKDHVDINNIAPSELAERLTLAGIAVDSIDDLKEKYKNIIVGEIKEIKPHKDASRLSIALVNDGSKVRNIVCGAPNIIKGQKVPLALPGAVLLNGVEIKQATIRGEVSEGMLCSAKELGLGEDHSGILILDKEAEVGKNISSVLGLDDVIFDLDLTPNRGDCFSVLGVAREVAALLNLSLKNFKICVKRDFKSTKDLKSFHPCTVKVKKPNLCHKYCCLVIKNVKVMESPLWLKLRLENIGIRCVNNIVDITNYIMFEFGEPLHAFDYEKVTNNTIIVRQSLKGEKIITLDGKERVLEEGMLVIADTKRAIGIAGIMGGANTEVTESTKDIILEAAIFSKDSIRETYRKLGVRTEASIRFEKGIDWYVPEIAIEKAARLIAEVVGGEISGGIISVSEPPPKPIQFTVNLEYINTLLGRTFRMEEVQDILERLGFRVDKNGSELFNVVVPSWRHDINIPSDIAEEVGRMFDYNNILAEPIQGSAIPPTPNKEFLFKQKVRTILKARGFNEVYTYSFYGVKDASLVKETPHIEIQNPTSKEGTHLRSSLIPLLLQVSSKNLRVFSDVKIFEIGTVFKKSSELLPKEETHLTGVVFKKDMDVYTLYRDLKGDIELLLSESGIYNDITFVKVGDYIDINYRNRTLGTIQILDEGTKSSYKIRRDGLAFDFDVSKLLLLSSEHKKYTPIPVFPSIERDLSFIIPKDTLYTKIVQQISNKSSYIVDVKLIDEYYIKEGERSITIRLTYRSPERTLHGEEVDGIEKQIVKDLEGKLGIKLRG